MNNKLLKYFALPLVLFASACSTVKSNESTIDPFKRQLAHNYKNMSDSAGTKYTIREKRLFKSKASRLMKGHDVQPEGTAVIVLRSGDDRKDLDDARELLMNALTNKSAHPTHLADMQFYFDCWVDQETRARGDKSTCKNKFIAASKNLKGHGCQAKEKVHFAFNEHIKISHEEMEDIKNFAIMAKNNNERILIIGHTDKTGSEHYNKALSLKRARRVADILVKHGVEKSRIKLIGAGEKWASDNDAASRNASLFFEDEQTMECFKIHHSEKHQCSKHHNHHENKHHIKKHHHTNKHSKHHEKMKKEMNENNKEMKMESKY